MILNINLILNIDINLKKKKSIVLVTLSKDYISSHLGLLRNKLHFDSSNYGNLLLLGDFNSEMTDSSLKDVSQFYWLKNLIKKPTSFKILIVVKLLT